MEDQNGTPAIGELEVEVPPEDSSVSDMTPPIEEGKTENPESVENAPVKVRRFATLMNLLNSLLGAGILSVPSSFPSAGIIISSIILLIIAYVGHVCTVMIMKIQLETGAAGFDEMTLQVSGKISQTILSISNLIFNVAANLAYLILGGDFITSWLNAANIHIKTIWGRAGMILAYSIILPVALSIPRSVGFLSYFSSAVVVFIVFYCIAIIVEAIIFFKSNPISEDIELAKIDITIFTALSIYSLTFSLPSTAIPIVHPYNPDIKKRSSVSLITTLLCYVMVMLPSVIAYLMFGSRCQGNIIKNFKDDDILMIIVRIAFFFIVSFSYPLLNQTIMCAWSQIFYKENDAALLPRGKRALMQLISHIIPVSIAMFLPEAKPVLNIGGSLGGCIVDFCYPALLWYMHYRPKVASFQFWGCAILGGFGAVVAVISTYQAVVDMITEFSNLGK